MNRPAAAGLALLLVACSAAAPAAKSEPADTPFASPSPTATTVTTPHPTTASTPASTPTPTDPTDAPDPGWGLLPPGSEARVVVDAGLRLRMEPGTGSDIVATLPRGTLVQLTGPPWQRDADGYEWRWVIVESTPEGPQAGWVATVGPGTFLTLEPIACPTGPVDLQTVIGMTALARLTCLGGHELVLEGTVVSGFGGYIPGTFEPAWLAHPFGFSGAISATSCCFFYHQPPGSELISVADGDRVRLTGHFDDPAAADCRVATGEPLIPEPDNLAVIYCRERFVATAIEILAR